MHPRAVGALVGAIGMSASLTVSCIATEPPGEQVGVFDVQSVLEENTCGPQAVIAADSEYAVELRQDGSAAYWQVLGGQPLAGRYEDPGRFEIQVRTSIQLYGPDQDPLDDPEDFFTFEPQQQPPGRGCTLVQAERLRGSFGAALDAGPAADAGADDAGSAEDSLEDEAQTKDAEADDEQPALIGTHRLEISPSADSDCSAAMAAQGGPFVALPCEVHYGLTAFRRPSD